MVKYILLLLLNVNVLLGVAQDNQPVSWAFSSEEIAPLTYKISFQATVKAPYHIYPQAGGGMGMPTEFIFVEDGNIEFIGEVEEKGHDSSEPDAAYYAKGATFTQTVKLHAERETILSFTIKFMACTKQFCLPPSTLRGKLPINEQSEIAEVGNSVGTAAAAGQQSVYRYEDFVMPDPAGKAVASKDILGESKYTLIDFWASWCAPCRAQARALMPLYEKYHAKGFRVIGVALDTSPAAWKRAIEADGYTWTNVSDLKGFESELVKKNGITAIPRTFLLDRQGNVVAMDLHGAELEAKLAELFN